MTLLTREAILGAQDLKSQDVDVPEWNGTVRVRMMTGAERDAIGAKLLGADNKPDMMRYRLLLVAACMVGEDGAALFGPDEVEQLAAKSSIALDRVFRAADALNDASNAAVESARSN